MDFLELLITVVFFVHGLVMLITGVTFLLPESARTVKERSWFLQGWTPFPLEVVLGLLLWGVSGVLFIAAAFGHARGAEWWGDVATYGGIGTIAAIVVWLGSVPPGTYIGAALALGVLFWSFFLR